jgi:hypothetical protein
LSISKVSKLKAEKVLKPPQKPVTTKNFHVLFKPIFSWKKYTKEAKIRVLITFENKVA